MGPGRFDNIFARLSVELDRMKRAGINGVLIDTFKADLLACRPADEPPPAALNTRTTPYALTVNRYEGFKRGEFTWEFVLKAWDECNADDQTRLNELFKGE